MDSRVQRRSSEARSRDDQADDLVDRIEPLVEQLQELKAQAASLGLFTDDRELLNCPGCGLRENVMMGGNLITYFEPNSSSDTGLRFAETEVVGEFLCPSCGEVAREPDEFT